MDATLTRRPFLGAWGLTLALAAVLGYVAISYTVKAMENRSAFLRWRQQILLLDTGTDIYQRFQYPNPPIMAMILRPLAEIEPPVAGALAWFAIKVFLAAASLWAITRMIEAGGVAFPPWARTVAILLVLRPLIGDLTHGNVNILILFLVTASLYAFHRNRDTLAGLMLALAICCKVTPLLFVPYFLRKRQWRVLIGTGAGLGAFLFLVPGLYLGWSENTAQLTSWTNQMVLPFVRDGVVSSEHPNQSLPGVVHRLLTHSPSFSTYPNGKYTPTEYHNIAEIGRDGARWLIRGAQGAFLIAMILLCRSRERGGWRVAAEFAFILVGMLIFSERTWKHHCVTLAMPLFVLVYVGSTRPMSRRARLLLASAVTVAMVLMVGASELPGKRGADLAQVYGVYLWAFLVLITALALVLANGLSLRPAHPFSDSPRLTDRDLPVEVVG